MSNQNNTPQEVHNKFNIRLLQRVDTKIREKVSESQRNIHVLTAHKPGPSKPAGKKKPPDVFPYSNRPKGVPVTFLLNKDFQGAITPQQGPMDEPNQTVSEQINTYGQPNQMQPNQIYGYSMGQQMYGQQQQMLGQAQIFGQQQMHFQPMYGQSILGPVPQMIPQPAERYPPVPMIETDNFTKASREQYSPTGIYDDNDSKSDYGSRDSDSSDVFKNQKKRQSAFERLGPQTKQTKPKLTINLCLDKEQPIREVVTKQVPVYERDEIMTSTDPTVMKFRYLWPWKNTIKLKRSVTARSSKTVMILEREQVEEEYKNDNLFMIVSVVGFPPSWTKENVLDAILEDLKEKSFIPCFIEFNSRNCKFLVNRCRSALLALHWQGFSIRKDDVELMITISVTCLNTKVLEYIPRLVIRNRLIFGYDGKKVDLSEFTLKSDISNFIYFPLNRPTNQAEIIELIQSCDWEHLEHLDLSHNRLTSIQDFDLVSKLPKLLHLDLSYNLLDNVQSVLPLRGLMLQSLSLEGNPLCLNYVDGDYYIKVFKTLFPCLRELDGVPIQRGHRMPELKQCYCLSDAKPLVEKFVSYFFRLLDLEPEKRGSIQEMYHKDAVLTVTTNKKLRYNHEYSLTRQLFHRSRCLVEGNYDFVQSSEKIGKLIYNWPHLRHDIHSFNIDVMMHTESQTLLRINGIVSTRSESLADEEKVLAFTRTVLLVCEDGVEYKIYNEMLYWDEATKECAANAFTVAIVQNETPSWKFESPLDDESKSNLINVFSKLTGLNSRQSSRCLEEKDWDLKIALEYFMKLLKLDNIECLAN
ncbi:nuclear RNA export factor 1 [Pieris rapae]|uniref:nuclear RNA export factor 1 n=1 Tax=Pieris rapae TaxID=64459 RepID=UPI001E27B91F|nr:nuclear RNA export factor 1 [Pieris rapae]